MSDDQPPRAHLLTIPLPDGYVDAELIASPRGIVTGPAVMVSFVNLEGAQAHHWYRLIPETPPVEVTDQDREDARAALATLGPITARTINGDDIEHAARVLAERRARR